MPNILKNIFSAGASKLVDSVATGLDNLITNKEEREAAKLAITQEINRNAEAIMNDATKQIELENEDRENARNSNTKIQESEHASWMAKNVAYVIDLTLLVTFLIMMAVIIYKVVPDANKEIFYMAFGSLISYLGTTITFHRGTSKGSEDKQKTMDKMLKKQ